MSKNLHPAYSNQHVQHNSVATYAGGACLSKHVIQFKDNDSCSYRWQGVKKASQRPGQAAYDAHRNPRYHIGGKGSGPFDPQNTSSVIASLGMAGVVVGRKIIRKRLRTLIEVNNFTTGRVPYGNQVHHILNQSSLHKGIDEIAAIWEPTRWTIVYDLLTEKYNLNHKDNNIILPTRDFDCRQTGLPKHCGGHPAYSAKILKAVKTALEPYRAIANQMKKKRNHDPMDTEQLKDDLVAISNTMYAEIITLAKGNRVKRELLSINDLPSTSYRNL